MNFHPETQYCDKHLQSLTSTVQRQYSRSPKSHTAFIGYHGRVCSVELRKVLPIFQPNAIPMLNPRTFTHRSLSKLQRSVRVPSRRPLHISAKNRSIQYSDDGRTNIRVRKPAFRIGYVTPLLKASSYADARAVAVHYGSPTPRLRLCSCINVPLYSQTGLILTTPRLSEKQLGRSKGGRKERPTNESSTSH